MDLDSLDNNWDLIDINGFLNDVPIDPFWDNHHFSQSICEEIDASRVGGNIVAKATGASLQRKESAENQCPQKRARGDSCGSLGAKACRERLRREKLNESFSELCAVLEPGRPSRTDKLVILGDAIRVLKELKSESQEYKETNEKLLEEIKTLKEDKKDLREEKMRLKADKERIEQQLKAMTAPTSLMPSPTAYHGEARKMGVFPGYGFVPMWQYLPPPVSDTSRDHELRPPAA
ncbi:hypothetical protein Leryth_006320 [Lithospermum erythrorhizon]|nr:hypothetical protein Leryth_006320 [Lithospermum erythrorhizon]